MSHSTTSTGFNSAFREHYFINEKEKKIFFIKVYIVSHYNDQIATYSWCSRYFPLPSLWSRRHLPIFTSHSTICFSRILCGRRRTIAAAPMCARVQWNIFHKKKVQINVYTTILYRVNSTTTYYLISLFSFLEGSQACFGSQSGFVSLFLFPLSQINTLSLCISLTTFLSKTLRNLKAWKS